MYKMSTDLDYEILEAIGAEVRLDLSSRVTDEQIDALRRLYDSHHLLVFRDQGLSFENQERVSGWFGPVATKAPSFLSPNPNLGGLGSDELAFHSDLSCATEPILGLSLHALDVNEEAAPTIFVDAIAAAEALPAALRERVEGRHVMNLWPTSRSRRQRRDTVPTDWPGTPHPILKSHPRTGRTILYVNASHSDRIVELRDDDSETLLQ